MLDINQIIKERRSIFPKEYTGEEVEQEVVETLLENAHWAPSHRLTLAWRFMVFGSSSKKQLFDYWRSIAPAEKLKKLNFNESKVSHIIILIAQDKGANPLEEEKASVACAVQNMYLSLHQFPDVGGYWGSGNGTYTQEFANFLDLKSYEHCMGYFMLGKVAEKRTQAGRLPVEQNITWMD